MGLRKVGSTETLGELGEVLGLCAALLVVLNRLGLLLRVLG